ncbi:hypothetical protein Angca_004973, partial [Angiostrongylus cantonensis]
MKTLVEANKRTTVRELAEQLGLTSGKISTRLNRIGKTNKWIPHDLNDNQENWRFEVSSA